MSTQTPTLLKLDRASEDVVEPTVTAEGSPAGDTEQASPP